MADAGGNSLWADIKNGKGNVQNDLLGPEYSYADTITGPTSMGVGSNGSFGQLSTNANAISYYVQALITGNPPLGNQFFVNTGGMCASPDGSLHPRYNYINNMSSGAAALPSSISELGSDFNGLIPGVADDIEGLNPLHMFSALAADSNPPCVCMSCPVTGSGNQSRFVNKDLDPDLTGSQCQQVDASHCMPPPESFTNQNGFVSAIPTIIAGLGILYFIFSGRK